MSKRIKVTIIIVEIIMLLGLSGYRVYECLNNNNEEIKENENNNDQDDDKENISDTTKKEIKILVYEINIRQEPDANSPDIGDVYMNQVYEVLDIVETESYTWYKIKKDNIVGYVANQKGEEWIECRETKKDDGFNTILYFYENDNEIIVLNSNLAFFEETKNEYDSNYKFISKYSCDNCYIGEAPSSCSISGEYLKKNKYVIIFDYTKEFKYILYDVYSENIIDTYNDLLFINESYVIAEKNNKYKIINLKNNISSDYYEDIANVNATIHSNVETLRSCFLHSSLSDYDINNKIITYKDNEKYGILSLENGQIILTAQYDLITIYKESIVATENDLEYVIDKYGNIISNGYNKIWYSNNDIIVTIDDGYANIIDCQGNSLLNDKINLSNYETTIRNNWYDNLKHYGGVALSLVQIDGEILLYVPITSEDDNSLNKYNYHKYIYNVKNNMLTKEKCVINTDELCN